MTSTQPMPVFARAAKDPRDAVIAVPAAPEDAPAPPHALELWPADWGAPAWTQHGLSCTSFVVGAAAYWLEYKRTGKDPGTPSFGFLYNNEFWLNNRAVKLMHALADNEKATMHLTFHIRAACRSAAVFGVPFTPPGEPPDEKHYEWEKAPPFDHYVAAREHLFSFAALFPYALVDPNDPRAPAAAAAACRPSHEIVRECLLYHGPVAVGINQYAHLPPDSKGRYPQTLPPESKRQSVGGHAVLLTGYDDEKRAFTYRNSMGPAWGESGYGELPYAWVDDDDATYDFYLLTPPDGLRRPRVMFHGVTVDNARAEPVHVRIDGFDGNRAYLGSVRTAVAAGATSKVTPVRWLDTHVVRCTVASDEAFQNVLARHDVICSDPDGRSAGAARVTIPAAAGTALDGELLCQGGKPIGTRVLAAAQAARHGPGGCVLSEG